MGRVNLKSMGALLSVALMILLMTSCVSAGVIFQDDFNDGNTAGWTNSGGTPWWGTPATSVVGGEFAWNGLGQSSADVLNGRADMDITVDVPNPGMSEGILIRYKDGNNYVIAFHNGWFNYIHIFQVFNGGYTGNNRVDTPGLTGAFTMHARVVGSQLTFDITDGINSYSTGETLQPQLLGSGKYGLWGDSGSAPGHNDDGILHFDNFVASDPGLGTVAGKVTDSDTGNPIAGAHIRLIAGGKTVVNTAVSDNNGDYSIDAVANDYTVLACAAGHVQQTKPVTVKEMTTATLNYVLSSHSNTTFYVRPDGDDFADGLTPDTAWKSIDNGDKNALLLPGDTVNILAGNYRLNDPTPGAASFAATLANCSGTASLPITYSAQGNVAVSMYPREDNDYVFCVNTNYTVLDGFSIVKSYSGFKLSGTTGVEIKNGKADGSYSFAELYDCTGCKVHNNVCWNTSQAIQCKNGNNCAINNNTIINNAFNAIGMWGTSTTGMVVKNNIIEGSIAVGGLTIFELGDVVPTSVVDHANNTFNNCYTAEKIGSVEYVTPIGAGEVAADPMYDPSNYPHLAYGSPCVDSGVDVGLPYLGTAPDRGAFEQSAMLDTAGTISGKVTDSTTQAGIPGARVNVMVDGKPLTTLTDPSGNYSIKANPGSQSVTAAATLYKYKTAPVLVPASGSVSVNIALDPGGEYYVKTDGNDYSDGLSPDGAWKSIDNGDKKNLLLPGDTVIVMAGNYSYLDPNPSGAYDYAVNLQNCFGAPGSPITYKAQGDASISMATSWSEDRIFSVVAGYIVLDGFTLSGGGYGVYVDSCEGIEIKNCKGYNGLYSLAVMYECFDSKAHNNLILNTAQAIQFRNGTDCTIANNTIVGNNFNAIGMWGVGTTGMVVKNNIINGSAYIGGMTIADLGDVVPTSLVDYSNNTFNNCNVAEKIGAVEHATPVGTQEFVGNPVYDPSNFHLVYGSPCIDSGVDVGLPYLGNAPDRGAFEWTPTTPFTADKISDLKNEADGTDVLLNSTVVTSGSGIMLNDVIYVEDESRAAGIQVISTPGLAAVSEGSRITVYGKMKTLPNGERAIQALNILDVVTGQSTLTSLGVAGKSVAGNGQDNAGLLVKIWGVVHVVNGTTGYFCVDDGSGKTDGKGNVGIPVIASDLVSPILPSAFPAEGSYVSIVGIADKDDLGGGFVSVVRPRSGSDIK